MDFTPIRKYLAKVAFSNNPMMQQQANALQQSLNSQEDEQIMDADVQEHHTNNSKDQDQLDALLQEAMPEMQLPDPGDNTTFGKPSSPTNTYWSALQQNVQQRPNQPNQQKMASAYIKDLSTSELTKDTEKDVSRFIGKKNAKVVQYGMVVSELLPKVDQHNFDQAISHVEEELQKKTIKQAKEEFFAKAKDKYIIILNDKIIDGHHFLAKAKELGITNSLNVLDLTPVRFQKSASVFTSLKRKYVANNRR